jgi:hypothetical protein
MRKLKGAEGSLPGERTRLAIVNFFEYVGF